MKLWEMIPNLVKAGGTELEIKILEHGEDLLQEARRDSGTFKCYEHLELEVSFLYPSKRWCRFHKLPVGAAIIHFWDAGDSEEAAVLFEDFAQGGRAFDTEAWIGEDEDESESA